MIGLGVSRRRRPTPSLSIIESAVGGARPFKILGGGTRYDGGTERTVMVAASPTVGGARHAADARGRGEQVNVTPEYYEGREVESTDESVFQESL